MNYNFCRIHRKDAANDIREYIAQAFERLRDQHVMFMRISEAQIGLEGFVTEIFPKHQAAYLRHFEAARQQSREHKFDQLGAAYNDLIRRLRDVV